MTLILLGFDIMYEKGEIIMTTRKWDVGDMCYHDFELCQVDKVEDDGKVSELTTGYVHKCTMDFRDEMLPVTIQNKLISEYYSNVSHDVHKMNCGLNFPDIARYIEAHWHETCSGVKARSKEYVNKDYVSVNKYLAKRYAELDDFLSELREAVSPTIQAHGVQIFSKNFPME